MFLFNEMILAAMPDENIGVLVFGVGLVLIAVGLRRFMKRHEKSAKNEMQHITH